MGSQSSKGEVAAEGNAASADAAAVKTNGQVITTTATLFNFFFFILKVEEHRNLEKFIFSHENT